MKEIFLTSNNNHIKISHFPGWTRYKYMKYINKFAKNKTTLPSDVTLITCVDDDSANYDKSPLIRQLKLNNIPFINAAEHKDVYPWVNNKKIQLICDALNKVNTKYCLILDGLDVVINEDLKDIVKIFKSFKKDIIFNATAWAHPSIEIDVIEDRYLLYGTFCYLNAGCCIGKTEALKSFYNEVLEEFKQCDPKDEYYNSEQYHVRKVFAKHMDTVFFDYKCKIFKVWHKSKVSIPLIDNDTHNIIYKIK